MNLLFSEQKLHEADRVMTKAKLKKITKNEALRSEQFYKFLYQQKSGKKFLEQYSSRAVRGICLYIDERRSAFRFLSQFQI